MKEFVKSITSPYEKEHPNFEKQVKYLQEKFDARI